MSRSSVYYVPLQSPKDLRLMRLLDEIYLDFPFYGVRRMRAELVRRGEQVGTDHVRTLLRTMGLSAIGPRPNTSRSQPAHKVYPYVLRDIQLERVNQVWSTDITYIPMKKGWLYLAAIMDWFSRFVLAWKVSITLEVAFCCEALTQALQIAAPEIFNSDQGAQFTSLAFTGMLEAHHIRISLDGRGRVYDNIFIERLWRSLKQEEVYPHDYECVHTATHRIGDYFELYNYRRGHQSLQYATPAEIYYAGKAVNSEVMGR